jgi:hypothetical protein
MPNVPLGQKLLVSALLKCMPGLAKRVKHYVATYRFASKLAAKPATPFKPDGLTRLAKYVSKKTTMPTVHIGNVKPHEIGHTIAATLHPMPAKGKAMVNKTIAKHDLQGWLISHGQRKTVNGVDKWTYKQLTTDGPKRISVADWPAYDHLSKTNPQLMRTYGYHDLGQLVNPQQLPLYGKNVLLTVCDDTLKANTRIPWQTSKLHQVGTQNYKPLNAQQAQAMRMGRLTHFLTRPYL